MTKPIPGAKTDPASAPTEGHGGENNRDRPHTQGKEGNGAQKLQGKRKRD